MRSPTKSALTNQTNRRNMRVLINSYQDLVEIAEAYGIPKFYFIEKNPPKVVGKDAWGEQHVFDVYWGVKEDFKLDNSLIVCPHSIAVDSDTPFV